MAGSQVFKDPWKFSKESLSQPEPGLSGTGIEVRNKTGGGIIYRNYITCLINRSYYPGPASSVEECSFRKRIFVFRPGIETRCTPSRFRVAKLVILYTTTRLRNESAFLATSHRNSRIYCCRSPNLWAKGNISEEIGPMTSCT